MESDQNENSEISVSARNILQKTGKQQKIVTFPYSAMK